MSNIQPSDVLFMGAGNYVTAWYRCILPAMALQTDWIGYGNGPPKIQAVTGLVRGQLAEPDYDDYKVIVVQQPHGLNWARWIEQRQESGSKVLYEIDDDVWSVAKMKSHGNRDKIRQKLRAMEWCIKVSDGVVCSTPYLAGRLRRFHSKVYVCEAGIDMERYRLERYVGNDMSVIGFGGGLGHEISLGQWIDGIQYLINKGHTFMCVGVDYSPVFEGSVIALPFTAVETWPATMSNFDIMVAPGGRIDFFRAKSELKWIEAAALGIPTVAHSVPYRSIRHAYDGFQVESAEAFVAAMNCLIDNPELRHEIGQRAREAVYEPYHIRNRVESWIDVFERVV